jgi:hypothetical protein
MDTISKIVRAFWPFLRAAWPVVAHPSKYGNRLSKEKLAHLAEMLLGAGVALGAGWLADVDPETLAGVLIMLWGAARAWRRDREAERDSP